MQRKFNPPVLFIESDYRNSRTPWKTNFEEEVRDEFNAKNQARA